MADMTTPQQHVEVLTNAARQWSAEEAASRSNAEFAVWLQLLTENEQHGSTYAVAFDQAARRIAALSAQGEEPVAWAYRSEDPYDAGQWMLAGPTWEGEPRPNRREVIPLYLHPAPPGSDAVTDTERLDFMERETLTVQAVAWPNGDAGDADVGWEVVEYSMTAPHVIRLGSGSTPREAIDAALAARTGKGEG